MTSIAKTDRKIKFQWQLNWPLLILSVIFLPILIKLGCWQLDRAEQKRTVLTQYHSLLAQPAQPFKLSENHKRYLPVQLSGHFLADLYWLIDHKVYRGRHGYQLVMAFQLDAGGVVLVNRGWLAAQDHRGVKPSITTPKGSVVIEASVSRFSDNEFIDNSAYQYSESNLVPELSWPYIKQYLSDSGPVISEIYLEIADHQSGALVVDFPPVNIRPEKHIGYAVQWFFMALALVILTVISQSNISTLSSLKRKRKSSYNSVSGEINV